MQNFIHDHFILQTKTAQELYHHYAKHLPIVDYHNHLSPKEIDENQPIRNITKAWLSEDHYKWRAMRACGVDEYFVTGKATEQEKFQKWAQTVPKTIRNPLFHWNQLELKRYFGIDTLLNTESATQVYEAANKVLAQKTPAQLLEEMKVEVVCTTDDCIDTLEHHISIAKKGFYTKVYPTFRSDNLFLIETEGYLDYLNRLSEVSRVEVLDLESFKKAIQQRLDFFEAQGCRLSDYGLGGALAMVDFTELEVSQIFSKKLKGERLTVIEVSQFRSFLMLFLCKAYHKKDWVQQFHIGVIRNNNSRLLETVGADVGCDSIADFSVAHDLSKLFNTLDYQNTLAKTITYNLNPAQNEVFASMMGNFQDGVTPGKMQWGSGWWYLDQKDGIEKQLDCLSNIGMLSQFIGMLTDSRSFLSMPRHEYFRRVLCNVLGEDIEKGLIPNNMKEVGKLVENICYHNAVQYFNFK